MVVLCSIKTKPWKSGVGEVNQCNFIMIKACSTFCRKKPLGKNLWESGGGALSLAQTFLKLNAHWLLLEQLREKKNQTKFIYIFSNPFRFYDINFNMEETVIAKWEYTAAEGKNFYSHFLALKNLKCKIKTLNFKTLIQSPNFKTSIESPNLNF